MVPVDQQVSDPISAVITGQIVAARRASGATRDEVAAAAREAGAPATFTASALRNIETSRRGVTVDELVWLATALAIPVRQLLGKHAALFGADVKPAPVCGPLEDATRTAIGDLGDLDGIELPLAEAAYVLARSLDDGVGMATAAVNKELRATLADLFDGRDDDEDDDGEDLGPS